MYSYTEQKTLEIENITLHIDTFKRTTGVDCQLLSADGDILYTTFGRNEKCMFCKKLYGNNNSTCTKAHTYGSYQAHRFGGKYIYFCPSGLLHFASVITKGGEIEYSLIGGPLLIIEKDEFINYDIILKNNLNEDLFDDLSESLKEIPVSTPALASDLSEMLMILASYLKNKDEYSTIINEENLNQQSVINEYVQSLKVQEINEGDFYPIEKEKQLLYAIGAGDKKESQRLLNEILGHIYFSSGNNFNVIKARVLELVVLLSRASLDGGADKQQIFALNSYYLSEINKFRGVEDLSFWLTKIMNTFTECVFNFNDVKHVDVVYKAIDYINRNYFKRISLEEVANFVCLSPTYFSKLFKDEMKTNFNTYLNSIRINKSKKLLLTDNVNLVDIPSLVGFEDQSYFSKVFKKFTGVTPGKYRESRGKNII